MFKEIVISNWKQIHTLEIAFPMEIFRGQADANWTISSSLSRRLKGTDWEDDPNWVECWFLREFRRRASHYLEHLPGRDDIIGWLALMQHYGTPTRLIDFTHSFYIACYFTLISAKSDAAIWAIDPNWLIDIGHEAFDLKGSGLSDEREDNVYDAGNIFLGRFLFSGARSSAESETPSKTGVISVEPFQFNKRLGSQQGLFALPLDLTAEFTETLKPYVQAGYPRFKKIIIRYDQKDSILGHLKEMNITSETLFPGIEGFASSIPHKVLCI